MAACRRQTYKGATSTKDHIALRLRFVSEVSALGRYVDTYHEVVRPVVHGFRKVDGLVLAGPLPALQALN